MHQHLAQETKLHLIISGLETGRCRYVTLRDGSQLQTVMRSILASLGLWLSAAVCSPFCFSLPLHGLWSKSIGWKWRTYEFKRLLHRHLNWTNVEICVTFMRRKPTSNEHLTMFSCWLYNHISYHIIKCGKDISNL